MEIIGRELFKLGEKHYKSEIGKLEPLTLEIYLAKTICYDKVKAEGMYVYTGRYSLINSRALPSEVLIEEVIDSNEDMAKSKFKNLSDKLSKKVERNEMFVKIKNQDKCAVYF